MKRFYCPAWSANATAEEVRLDEGESHHLQHVLRLGVGARVVLFDGRGGAVTAEVLRLDKRGAVLRPLAANNPPPHATAAADGISGSGHAAPLRLTLAVAPPKHDRLDWLVEKATELSVERLVPLVCERGVVQPRETKLDRLRQTVIAACKQSGRNHLLDIAAVTPWPEFLRGDRSGAAASVITETARPRNPLLVFDPSGRPFETIVRDELFRAEPEDPGPLSIRCAIGPEGGFTPEELAQAQAAGASIVRLHTPILRVETAAIAVAGYFALRGT